MTNKYRVLLVDDQADVLKMLGMFFRGAGFEVDTAVDGPTAFNLISNNKPDVIILDVMMPGMSGIDVCSKLRSQPHTARIPIIMLSAKGELDDKMSGFEAGADDYVTKPVARQELLARANALLNRAQYSEPTSARVITFVGAKGGVGTTTVAINVAAALVAEDKSVTLIEMRSHPGTMIHHLKLDPAQDLGDLLAVNAQELTVREINRRVMQHPSGLRLITAPKEADGSELSTQHVTSIVSALIPNNDYVLIDLPTIAGVTMRHTLDLSDQIILITEPEIAAIRAARIQLETLHDWLLSDRTKVVVVNRSSSATMMRRDDIETSLGYSTGGGGVISIIQPMPEAFQQASRSGVPVVIGKPQILPSQSLLALTNWLAQHTQAA